MTDTDKQQLGKTLWAIADQLRGAMNADDFRDYMLSFLFLRYLSDSYEKAAKKELGRDYPDPDASAKYGVTPLQVWYDTNTKHVAAFEKQMRRKAHYVIKPQFLWGNIVHLAKTQNRDLLDTLQKGFKYIEEESFSSNYQGLFSEINLNSEKLGRRYEERNKRLCEIIGKIAEGMTQFSTDTDTLGDAYEYLIGQFAAGSGKKAGEFYTPQRISDILSANQLSDEHIERIVATYQDRPKKPIERYARRVPMEEIEKNGFNLNISRYVSTAEDEVEVDLAEVHKKLVTIDGDLRAARDKHNAFLKELGLPPLP